MNETSTTLATLRRQPTNRCVTNAELRIDLCAADGRTFCEIARWEQTSGTWRKTSHCNRLQVTDLDIVIDALERARDMARAS